MLNADIHKTLTNLFEQGIAAANDMAALLESEQDALVRRASEEISDIANKKLSLLEVMSNFDQRRKQLFEQHQLPNDTSENLCSWFVERQADALAELWQQFATSLEQCKQLNSANGRVISKQQKTVERILATIRPSSSEAPATYSADGKSSYSFSSQSIDKA